MIQSEIEQVVIALAIDNPSSVHDVARLMRPEDIADRALADAWTTYRASIDEGRRWDAEALAMALRARGAPEAAHAVEAAYMTLRRSRVRSDSIEVLAREVGEGARLRRLRDALVDALEITRTVGPERTTEEVIRQAMDRIDLASEERARGRAMPIRQFAEAELERLVSYELGTYDASSEGLGVPLGFGPLDAHLQGIRPGELVIVAGSTGSGKTSFATGAAVACAAVGQRSLVLTYEMIGDEYMRRIASYESGTAESDVTPARIHTLPSRAYLDAVRRYASPSEGLGGLIGIDDRPATIDEIETLVRAEVRRAPLALVVVDHVGLIRRPARTSEYDAITNAIVRLKLLANECRVSIVALAQLNREIGKRENARPRLSDLRSSGELEQSANFVVFPFRPSYASKVRGELDGDLPEVESDAEIILGKARRKGLASWRATFTGSACRFDEYRVVEEATVGTNTYPTGSWDE